MQYNHNNHNIVDDDPHFIIDAETRAISYASPDKLVLIQGDHNSERFTFELPAIVDGHEMVESNIVQVHYININGSDTSERSQGVYEVTDLALKPDDDTKIVFSWLVSQKATLHVGVLNFAVRFKCQSEGESPKYVWNTAPYSGVTISTGIDSGEGTVEEYYDILDDWYNKLVNAGATGIEAIESAKNNAVEDIDDAKNDALTKVDAQVKVSADEYVEKLKSTFTADVLNTHDVIVQEKGYSPDKIISQKVVTEEFNALEGELVTKTTEAVNGARTITSELEERILEAVPSTRFVVDDTSKCKISTGLLRETNFKVYIAPVGGVIDWNVKFTLSVGGAWYDKDAEIDDVSELDAASGFGVLLEKVTFYMSSGTTPMITYYVNGSFKQIMFNPNNIPELGSSPDINDCSLYLTNVDKVYRINTSDPYTFNANGIADITKTSTDVLTDTYTISFDNGQTKTFNVTNGNGITSVERTDRGDYEDTYIMYFKDGSSNTFKIPNGGSVGIKKTVSGTTLSIDDISPIEHGVQVKVKSKNLLPVSAQSGTTNGATYTCDSDGSVKIDTTPTSGFNLSLFKWSNPKKLNGTYTISIGTALPKGSYFWLKDSNGAMTQLITYYSSGSVSKTLELNGNYTEFGMWISVDGTFDNHVFRPQLEEGTVATTYTPYVDVSAIALLTSGKNLIRYPYVHGTSRTHNGITYTVNDDRSITATGTASGESWFVLDTIDLGDYMLTASGSGYTNGTFVRSGGADYHGGNKNVTIYVGNGVTVNETYYPQVEFGTVPTAYEPYIGKIYTPNLDGTVSGVSSIAPVMNMLFLTADPAVIIEAKYNKGIEAMLEEIGEAKEYVDQAVASVKEGEVPDYVNAEADAVVKRILPLQNENTFTFATITDAHVNYGEPAYSEPTLDGIKHAGMAINRVASQIGIDFMCNLGDNLWGTNEDVDLAKNEQLLLNQAIYDAFRGYLNFRLIGNHDANLWNHCIPTASIYSMNGRYNTFDEVGPTKIRGYGYKDFDHIKVRVLGMNTSDYIDGKGGYYVSDEQMLWLMSALDLSDKTDADEWQVLLLSHIPLDFPTTDTDTCHNIMAILEAYKNGTSVTVAAGSYDYSGKNKAEIICNIHGHIHNFSRGLMGNGVLRVCTPNTCFYNNGSPGVGVDEPYQPNESYNKIANSAKDTTVTFYTIDTKNRVIYSTNYGAGYDRAFTYDGVELHEDPFEEVVADLAIAPRSQWTHTASTHETILGLNNAAMAIGVSTPNDFAFTDRDNNPVYVMPVPYKAKKVTVTNTDSVAYTYGFMLYNAVDGLLSRVLDSGWTNETEYSFAKGVATYITISAKTQDGAFVPWGYDDSQVTVTFSN